MALAERTLAARWGDDLVDHRTYVIAGDGCLVEGISQEAISLAGHHKLSKLIVFFDDNGISIDGPVSLTTSDDQLARFAASGWACQAIDGHDPAAIADALRAAPNSDRPVLIACRTVIGYGAPNKAGGAGRIAPSATMRSPATRAHRLVASAVRHSRRRSRRGPPPARGQAARAALAGAGVGGAQRPVSPPR